MSKLNELIQELCPNGVEYKRIEEVYSRLRGTPITAGKMKDIENSDGEIKIFAGGKTIINAYEADIPNANITRVPAVLVQSRGVIDFIYYDKPFTFKNEMWAYTTDNATSVKFLYYVLKNNVAVFRDAASRTGSLPQISLQVTEDFKIPVPPLEVQREIVRILDNFTELTAELTVELTARKKQYEYYRNKLLTFDEDERICKLCLGGVEYRKLNEVAVMKRGTSITKREISEGEIPVISGGKEPAYYCDSSNREGETITVAGSGAGAGFVQYWTIPIFVADAFSVKGQDEVSTKYLYYCLSNDQEYIYSTKKGGGVPHVHISSIENLLIPVPPLEVQREIVRILDNFMELTAELEVELVGRKKQYEYYRDKLLTFK